MEAIPLRHTFHQPVLAALEKGPGKAAVIGTAGSFPAFLCALLLEDLKAPLLVVTATEKEAQRLGRDLNFFLRFLNLEPLARTAVFTSDESPYFFLSLSDQNQESSRVSLLAKILEGGNQAIVTSITALGRKVIPKAELAEYLTDIRVGQELERDRVLSRLVQGGYRSVSLVEGPGEFSLRGGLVDIFCPAWEGPLRVEFFGDTVESIREFDPASQRSYRHVQELRLTPASGVIFKEELKEQALARVRDLELNFNFPRRAVAPLVERLKEFKQFQGLSHFGALCYREDETLLDYFLPSSVALLISPDELRRTYDFFWKTGQAASQRAAAAGDLVLPPEMTHLRPEALFQKIGRLRSVHLEAIEPVEEGRAIVRVSPKENADLKGLLKVSGKEAGIISSLAPCLYSWIKAGFQVNLVCPSRYGAERLRQLLADSSLPGLGQPSGLFAHLVDAGQPAPADAIPLRIWVGELSCGFRLEGGAGLAVLTEDEIFGEKRRLRTRPVPRTEPFLLGLRQLHLHDYVVHVDHGIGVYRGLLKLTFDGVTNDYLLLEYYGGDKLYLPVEKINLLSRYMGPDDVVPSLDHLGSRSFARMKQKVRESLRHVAEELVKIYAQRQVLSGYNFTGRDHYFNEFEATFPYDETPDQLKAIEEVLADMQSERPMDRLVCGDVGFGKTEVALRAAFKVVMDGKQVAVLVPTTVLAAQHHNTFVARLASYPIETEVLSRFKSRAQQKVIIQGLKNGTIDIVIGTHRLLQGDVAFRDLGLLVIDEEHRFGVRHKEKTKKLRALVDVLTLSATPIPRTLQLSLTGIRDLSIIETPPEDRLAIETFVTKYDDGLIAEAIRREMARQGQVFFVHNRVENIDRMAQHLQKLAPEARIGIAHGQMEERELEQVMVDFLNGAYDVLVTTTIIESGLDYPRANTIFINRADRFGLAQLYQLRGRVGRANVQAYAYLIIPAKSLLTRDAQKRLSALMELTSLGSGFRLAAHDLQIRGAGNLLGTAQSGHVRALGYDLYMELLAKAIAELKGEEIKEEVEPTVSLGITAYIPDDFIEDVNTRLVIYKRLSSVLEEKEFSAIQEELKDRFGPLPLQVKTLLKIMEIRRLLKLLMAVTAKRVGDEVKVEFHDQAPVTLEKVLSLRERWREIVRLSPEREIIVSVAGLKEDQVLARIKELLASLAAL